MRRYEAEADACFRRDASALGYLAIDPHSPGDGRGLYAYYRDNGIVPPEVLARKVPDREKTIGLGDVVPTNLKLTRTWIRQSWISELGRDHGLRVKSSSTANKARR
jgi:hypothetical protein